MCAARRLRRPTLCSDDFRPASLAHRTIDSIGGCCVRSGTLVHRHSRADAMLRLLRQRGRESAITRTTRARWHGHATIAAS